MNDNTEVIRLYKENKNNIIDIIPDVPIIYFIDKNKHNYIQVSNEKPFSMRLLTIYGATYQELMQNHQDNNPDGTTIKYEDNYFQLSDKQYNTLND